MKTASEIIRPARDSAFSVKNHERIHAYAVRLRRSIPEADAGDLFGMASRTVCPRVSYRRPFLP